ncbi:MAG: GNAT family N-acetyltransferase [Myxococcaceae bacterium]|nr:GNAT family N-acetyltransferase [Myxococcaceae bacterium]
MLTELAVRGGGLSAPSELTVEVHGSEALPRLSAEWDALVRSRPDGAPFALSGWTRVWCESFAPGSPLKLLCARRDGRAQAFAPFIERRGRLAGCPVRLWQSPSNEHSQRTAWALGEQPETAVEAIWSRLREQPWELLLLKDIVAGGAVDAGLGRAAEREGFLVSRWPAVESPWLPVRPPEVMEAQLDARFRSNLRRRRKKLAQRGELRLERIEGGERLGAALEEGFRLEGGGWKGTRGTAMASQPETHRFYTSLARLGAQEGWLALYLLSAGDRPIAFHYGLEFGGTYFLLKPGYDEAVGECSPGQLLVDEVLRDLAHRGAREFDFLGPKMTWKLDWTENLRPHCWLFILRPTVKGRLLHAARFQHGPRLARQWRQLTRWIR